MSRTQLEQARRQCRGERAGYGETRDGVWHRLVVGSFAHDVATLACAGRRVEIRRIATDLPDRDITCAACRTERTDHAG